MKALLLDLDNTLIDREAALLDWLRSALPTRACTERNLQVLITDDQGGYGCRHTFFASVARLCGGTAAEAQRRFTQGFPERVRLKRDADAMLRAFAGTTVIVTNGGSVMQRRKLACAGLEGRVSHVLVSDECGLRKPDAAIFARALELAGCTPDQALMVGDHPEVDLAGARAAGIAGVLVRTRWFDVPPGVRHVHSLTELAC